MNMVCLPLRQSYSYVLSINASYKFSNSSSFGLTVKTFKEKITIDEGIASLAFNLLYFIQKK